MGHCLTPNSGKSDDPPGEPTDATLNLLPGLAVPLDSPHCATRSPGIIYGVGDDMDELLVDYGYNPKT